MVLSTSYETTQRCVNNRLRIFVAFQVFSCYALHRECDAGRENAVDQRLIFQSTLTPYGVRLDELINGRPLSRFQSTHSIQSATYWMDWCCCYPPYFNPRTPYGVRLGTEVYAPDYVQFQSTHSIRSATNHSAHIVGCGQISIHALHTECD